MFKNHWSLLFLFFNQGVRMVYPIADFFIGDVTIYHYCIPVFFIHVVSRQNCRVSLAKFQGKSRVALQVYGKVAIEVDESKYLSLGFKDQGIVSKRQALRYILFGEAIFPY